MSDARTSDIKTRISAAMRARLEAEAARHELAVSDVVRAALREYFEQRDRAPSAQIEHFATEAGAQ